MTRANKIALGHGPPEVVRARETLGLVSSACGSAMCAYTQLRVKWSVCVCVHV